MRNILVIVIVLLFSGCLKKPKVQCFDFISEMDKMKSDKIQFKDKYKVLKDRAGAEFLIFQYEKYREFSHELDSYLHSLRSIEHEEGKYSGSCNLLVGLSKSKDKGVTKRVFENKIKDDFVEASKVLFDKYQKEEIILEECIGYLNHAVKLVTKYQKSRNYEEHQRVNHAIQKFKSCKNRYKISDVDTSHDSLQDENIKVVPPGNHIY